MLWSYNGLVDPEDVIVENQVKYNGNVFDVKYIYEKAFSKISNINSIKIENNIRGFCDSKGNLINALDGFFKNNKNIKGIDLGNIENLLGEKCFASCDKIVEFNMSKNINSIGRHSFSKCYSLKKIDLSKIIKFDGQNSFEFCRELRDVGEFNDELTELPARTFLSCDKLKIASLKNIRKLGDECFKNCRFLDNSIVSNAEEIGKGCFSGCNFNEIYLKKAKKIYDNAFSEIFNLKKVRFGSSEMPFLSGNIVENSSVNQWIYPKDYATQPNYNLLFLNKLKVSSVKWFYNDESSKYETTQHVKLNSFSPPKIERENYEMEGWYKEPECINKVTMIGDLGEVIGDDIVIKEPKLYAKWKCTIESKPTESQKQEEKDKLAETQKQEVENKSEETQKQENKPIPPSSNKEVENDNNKTENVEKVKDEGSLPKDKPKEQELESENNNLKQSEEPIKKEETSKNNDNNNKELEKEENKSAELQRQTKEAVILLNESKKEELENNDSNEYKKSIIVNDISKSNDSSKSIDLRELKRKKEESNYKSEKKQRKIKKRVKLNEDVSRKINSEKNTESDIKDFQIKINSDKEIKVEQFNVSTLDYKMAEVFISSIFRDNSTKLQILNISYKDVINTDMEINNSWILGKIMRANDRGIYLKNNDYFNKEYVIEFEFKENADFSKLYLYNEELKKFMLDNDKLEVQDNIVRIKTSGKKEYLITNFELNKDITE